jgi:uncharacterized protein (DUF1800 family)
MEINHTLHLLNRAALGADYNTLKKCSALSREALVDKLFNDSKQFAPLKIKVNGLPDKKDFKNLSKQEKKELKKKLKDKVRELNTDWLQKLISGEEALRERMTFFWHNHFACRDDNPITLLELNNLHRQYAFAPFKQLLMAVSKSPSMLLFLNNQQNKKEYPNENFARELMELFTIGRGNYTEQDIKEAARSFTGWAFNRETYEFEFRANVHDTGTKKFMGQSGDFDGEEIIDIVLSKKETAIFLCTKIYKHFVTDKSDAKIIAELADFYFANNYDTEKLMRKIFLSDWFYASANIGSLIKSPVELIVSLSKTLKANYQKPEVLLYIQRALGQVLFYPPNVAGWPGGTNWIDSSSFIFRLRLPSLLANGGVIDLEMKDDMPEEFMKIMEMKMEKQREKVNSKMGCNVNWQQIENVFTGKSIAEIASSLLSHKLRDEKIKLIDDNQLRDRIMKILSIPEYQMC